MRPLSAGKIVSLTITAIHAPYLFLAFAEGARKNWSTMLAIRPIFPGFTLSLRAGALRNFDFLKGTGATLVLALLFLALALSLSLQLRRSLWLILGATTLTSTDLVYVVVLMMRA